MCPMCMGTAALVLSGSGAAGGAVFALGYIAWKKRAFRLFRSLRLRRKVSS